RCQFTDGDQVPLLIGNLYIPDLGSTSLMDDHGLCKDLAFPDTLNMVGRDFQATYNKLLSIQKNIGSGTADTFGQGHGSSPVQNPIRLIDLGGDRHFSY